MGMRTDNDRLIKFFFSVMGASRDKGNHYQQLGKQGLPDSLPCSATGSFCGLSTMLQ